MNLSPRFKNKFDKRGKSSVVQIISVRDGSPTETGTGFLIQLHSSQLNLIPAFVTCKHCMRISNENYQLIEEYDFKFACKLGTIKITPEDVRRVWSSPDRDLLVMHIKEEVALSWCHKKARFLETDTIPEINSSIAIIGYPGEPNEASRLRYPIVYSGDLVETNQNGYVIAKIESHRGNSGSPYFNMRGKVYAVHKGGPANQSCRTWGIPISSIFEMIAHPTVPIHGIDDLNKQIKYIDYFLKTDLQINSWLIYYFNIEHNRLMAVMGLQNRNTPLILLINIIIMILINFGLFIRINLKMHYTSIN